MFTTENIRIRDPYLFGENGEYYLFGTTGSDPWQRGCDFTCYCSRDFRCWDRLERVVTLPQGFWADRQFWAPEVHRLGARYYMLMTCSDGKRRGTHVFAADSASGVYRPVSQAPLTPPEEVALDGTLYEQEGQLYLVYSQEWTQIGNGRIKAVPVSRDLTRRTGSPFTLLSARESGVAKPFRADGRECYVTDGPWLHRAADGALLLLWSTNGSRGYCVAVAESRSGIRGPFVSRSILFEADGGHCMTFRDGAGRLCLCFHQPNDTPRERLAIFALSEEDGCLRLGERLR